MFWNRTHCDMVEYSATFSLGLNSVAVLVVYLTMLSLRLWSTQRIKETDTMYLSLGM